MKTKHLLIALFLLLFNNTSGFSQAPATPGAITGSSPTSCPNDGAGFSIAPVAGATSYTWTVPASATISGGQGSPAINVVFQNTTCWAGNDITVTASNTFGTSAAQTITLAYLGTAVFDNYNPNAVSDGGLSPSFTIASPTFISMIYNYHWNGSVGTTPGTISLFNTGTSITYGPWPATAGSGGCGGGTPINWTVYPSTIIPAGTYQVIDSDPATWSYNTASGGYGFTHVESCPASPPPPPPVLCPPFSLSQTNVSCFGDNDGSATVNISDPAITFLWNTIPPQTTSTATGLTAGTYTVSIIDTTTTELIVNGDFSAGNSGFSTDYLYCNTPGCLGPEGYYAIDVNPNIYNGWTGAGHTISGPNNFMIVNGNPIANQSVWCQTVTVTPNSNYTFSTWISTMDPGAYNPAVLQFSINGTNLGSPFTAPLAQNVWWQFSTTWNSGTNTTASICIVNQNTGTGSNDFGLDDISFIGIGQNCDTTATFIITQPALLTATATTTAAFCIGGNNGTATVAASGGTGAFTYSWNTTPTQNTATATGLTAGNYTVVVTDANGCTKTVTAIVTTINQLMLSTSATQTGCILNNGTATAIPSGGTAPYSYSWNTSPIQTTQTTSGLATGNYTVIVTDANSCTQTQTVIVTQTSNPTALVSAASTNIPIGASTQLIATGGNTYSWSPITGLDCTTCANPTATPNATTDYCVFVADANGCTDSTCITISIEMACGEVFVPEAFSPNNDLANDLECVFGNCIQDFYFAIYDRWGETVFETTDQKNCWNGTYKGKLMNTAVFVYYLKATLLTGEQINKKGNITLIR